MRFRAVLPLAATIAVLLITWEICFNSFDVQETVRNILGRNYLDLIKPKFEMAITAPEPKCSLSRACPPGQYALHIRSGAADVVGPKICFDGEIMMSHVMNNVGPGLNIVILNGENGVVKKSGYLNMKTGNQKDILAYLKEIKTGMIVLVASFDDVTIKMTDGMREVFVGMGSALIKSVKYRDNWVFAGRAGAENYSLFEKLSVNDVKNNVYEKWPEVVEVGGCFSRTSTDGQKP